jgi:DNA-binding CsgD family transcriptional regulator
MVRLNARERTIFRLFLDGNGACEIARALKTSHSAICRTRGRIRSIALQIGLGPTCARPIRKKK